MCFLDSTAELSQANCLRQRKHLKTCFRWCKSSLISPLPRLCFRVRKWNNFQAIKSVTYFSISSISLKSIRPFECCGSSSIDVRFEMCQSKQGSFNTRIFISANFQLINKLAGFGIFYLAIRRFQQIKRFVLYCLILHKRLCNQIC